MRSKWKGGSSEVIRRGLACKQVLCCFVLFDLSHGSNGLKAEWLLCGLQRVLSSPSDRQTILFVRFIIYFHGGVSCQLFVQLKVKFMNA